MGYPSWGLCARIDVAHLDRLAQRGLSDEWSITAGNDGHVVLFGYRGAPNYRFAQKLAAVVGEAVVLLDFDHDLYCADQVGADGSEQRLVEKPASVLASHGIDVPGDETPVIYYDALAVGVDRAAIEVISWDSDYEARQHERGVLVTGGTGTLGVSAGRWSRKLKCEVFIANWEPAARAFVCLHIAPGVDESVRWRDGKADGAVAGATEPAGVLRAAGIPVEALGMDDGDPTSA